MWIDPDGVTLPLAVEWRVAGRFAPPVEREEETVPGQPGSRLRTVRHDARDFSLALWIEGASENDLRTQMRDITYLMDGVRGDGRIRVTSPLGDQREIVCRVTGGLEMSEVLGDTSGPTAQRAVVTLRAVDPYWQDTTDTAAGPWAQGGTAAGFFPFFPLRLTSSEVLATATVDNLGDVEAWPVWTVVGPGSTITLKNQTTGKTLALDTTLGAGESVVIDTRPGYKTVTKNDGTNLYPNLSSTSSLWSLIKGPNAVQIEIGGATSATSVSMLYRHKYLAV